MLAVRDHLTALPNLMFMMTTIPCSARFSHGVKQFNDDDDDYTSLANIHSCATFLIPVLHPTPSN